MFRIVSKGYKKSFSILFPRIVQTSKIVLVARDQNYYFELLFSARQNCYRGKFTNGTQRFSIDILGTVSHEII